MNNNSEKEYWARAMKEVLDASPLTLEELALRLKVSSRQLHNYKLGDRPCGLVAIRLYFYRKELLEPELFGIESKGAHV